MGETIGVSSQVGVGSTFWFTVCLPGGQTAPAEAGRALPSQRSLALQGAWIRRNVRVLVADDHISNRQVAEGLLRKLGRAVDTVKDCAEAVEAVGSAPYDLVLMDVRMPVMDGFEATKQIRQSGTLTTVRPRKTGGF